MLPRRTTLLRFTLPLLATSLATSLAACALGGGDDPNRGAEHVIPGDPGGGGGPSARTRRVFIVDYEPIYEISGEGHAEVTLRQKQGWNDPFSITNDVIGALATSSHGQSNYVVVGQTEIAELPAVKDGYVYSAEQIDDYMTKLASPAIAPDPSQPDKKVPSAIWPACQAAHMTVDDCQDDDKRFHAVFGHPVGVDVAAAMKTFDAAGRINRGEIDEVWVVGPPFPAWSESTMSGPTAYWCNSNPTPSAANRNFVLMWFNYAVGVGNALHSYGHRAESILDHIYGTPAAYGGAAAGTLWDEFTQHGSDLDGVYGVGTVHMPFNTSKDYDYASSATHFTDEGAWTAMPFWDPGSIAVHAETCAAWGCSGDPQLQYMKWWYGHMPAGQANTAGLPPLPNWWSYVTYLDELKDTPLPPPPKDKSDHGH